MASTIDEKTQKDLEAGVTTASIDETTIEEVKAAKIQSDVKVLRVMRKGEEWLDAKMGIELQGIDRIPENEKQPPSLWNAFLFWWSLNIHVGVVPLGVLGPEFGLSFRQSLAASLIGIFLGALCTAFTATLGPKLGLRTIACSRYSFGFWGAKLCSVLNVVVGAGFAVVNYVVVGQILSAVSDYTMTISVGIVIIAILSYVLSVFGFKVIHTFEKYSWISTFILFCVLIGQAAPNVTPDAPAPSFDVGLGYYGSFLSILAINFSNSSGWCSISSDYSCQYSNKVPSWKIFVLTWWGVVLPTSFSIIIGICLGQAAVGTEAYPPYADAYTNHGLGGLLLAVYHPVGWAKFALVLLTFSVLGNNIAINYSNGLSLQLLGHYFHAVPRLLWSLVVAIVIAVLAIAGQQNLSNVISNFVSLLGYWTVSFTLILLIEDKIFRRREGYNLLAWDNARLLPWGVAAVFSLLVGYLCGGVTGMAQTLYIGPIAAKFGGFGGDVGIYLSAVFTLLVYPPTRYLEKKYTGR